MPRPMPQAATPDARCLVLCALEAWIAPRMMPTTENPNRLAISAPTARPSARARGHADRSPAGDEDGLPGRLRG